MIGFSDYQIKPSLEAEASVIGAMIVSPEIVPEVMQKLEPRHILTPEYRTLCAACFDLYVEGKGVDHVSILGKVGERNDYRTLLAQAVQMMPSSTNWESYADIVIDRYQRSKVVGNALELLEEAETGEISDLREKAISTVENLSDVKKSQIWSSREMFFNFYTSLQQEPEYQSTGIKRLDKKLYIESGDFIIVGARPSVGKTAFGVQLGLNMAKTMRVGFFSLETSNSKISGRAVGNFASINQNNIKSRKNLDFAQIGQSYDGFKDLDFYVIEAAGWSPSQIQSTAVQLELDVAIVDYLQIVRTQGNGRFEKVTNASVQLSTMARSRKITTIALAQLNRDGVGEPTMEDLRESGQIEQDADAILLLHSVGENKEPARNLYIAKNKEGETGAMRFAFDGALQRFVELESRYGE